MHHCQTNLLPAIATFFYIPDSAYSDTERTLPLYTIHYTVTERTLPLYTIHYSVTERTLFLYNTLLSHWTYPSSITLYITQSLNVPPYSSKHYALPTWSPWRGTGTLVVDTVDLIASVTHCVGTAAGISAHLTGDCDMND